MSVSLDDVRRIAKLARLRFSPEEEEILVDELGVILEYMSKLQGAENIDAELQEKGDYSTDFRPDIVGPSIDYQDALKNATHTSSDYFEVPKVIRKHRSDNGK